jgi:hypothetical protein
MHGNGEMIQNPANHNAVFLKMPLHLKALEDS